MQIFRALAVGAVFAAGAMSLAACNPTDEKPCSSGSYPVKASDGGAGQTCAKSGEPIPSGYTTYAPGHTPTTPGGD